jgi:phosphopantothenate synthetase
MQVTIDKMWAAMAVYQPTADADGHGETWALMCSERTEDAAEAAWAAAVAASRAAYKSAVFPCPGLGILTASSAASDAAHAIRATAEFNWSVQRATEYMDGLNSE